MRKNTKKTVVALAACTLMGAMAVGGTFAYLTDSESATNTFTVGEIQIDLTESEYTQSDNPRVPNEVIEKNPTVRNTGKNDAVMFVSFDIPMANVITANDGGTRKEAQDTELFDFATTSGNYDSVNDGWVQLSRTVASDNSKVTYVYGYSKVVPAKDDASTEANETKTPSVFDKVRFANIVEGQIAAETKLEIPVRAYAIQSSYIADISIGDTSALTKTELANIYEVYMNQNKDIVKSDDADTNGSYNLSGKGAANTTS